ncbi:MAG: translation initiation factor IF-2 N-terminal domain-containing protein, partial [Deltaproteobacteria bacterium]
MITKLKVYELAKELTMDGQHLVDLAQRLGIDVKNTMSVLGTEEVRTIREHHKKNKTLAKSAASKAPAKPQVTEKRVGTTVIRRRSAAKTPAEAPVETQPEAPITLAAEEQPVSVEENVVAELETQGLQNTEPDQIVAETPVTETAEINQPVVAESQVAPEVVEVKAKEEKPVVVAKPVEEVVVPKAKRFFPSIIKKVATEEYLGEKVGPKIEKVKREIKPSTTAKPASTSKPSTAPSTGASSTGLLSKRVKEVDMATAAQESAKVAGKRRLLERQNTVFKSADFLKRELVHSTKKKKTGASRPALKTQITTPSEHKRVVEMGDNITVGEFAKQLSQKAGAIISKLMGMGVTASINEKIDLDTATLLAQEFGFELKHTVFKEEEFIPQVVKEEGVLKSRGPVVTIMGHVDHGKTSILDAI